MHIHPCLHLKQPFGYQLLRRLDRLDEAQAAIEMTVQYAKDRRAFGAPLWDKQVIRQRLAELCFVETTRDLEHRIANDLGFQSAAKMAPV